MAAYAALISFMRIIDQIQHHPRPPISLDEALVESLTEKVAFLQEFLEGYSHVGYSEEADPLETRIAEAAYAAEDVIESHIVDQILAESKSRRRRNRYFNCFQGGEEATSHGKMFSSIDLYQGLQKVIEEMDSIKKEVMEIKGKMGVQDQLQRSSIRAVSQRSSSTGQNTVVGFDNVLLELMDKLTGGQLDRQIIPIVGMGGIGKTTLARNIYQNQMIVQHFDILVWVTISQRYQMREILLELLQEDGENLSKKTDYELGDRLHKRLSGRRYLIIMDDIWDIEVWDQLKFFFPNNNNGSRIMLTTRLSNMASQVADFHGIDMAFLDEDNSWNLFSETVFGKESCPLELEEIGKKIVKNCKGLPLSIVVIGGLLAKSKHTREYWEYISENLNSTVNLDDNEGCLKILHMSYNNLPIHLKPCFLYMGVFPEDSVIRVSALVKLWVAEGFLKPINSKSLEVVAQEYLKELISRNLILVHELGAIGNIKYCNIHDLVRDLCLREAQKERFYNVAMRHSLSVPQGMNRQRRIVITANYLEEKALDALQSMSLARSLISYSNEIPSMANFRLFRILKTQNISSYCVERYVLKHVLQLVNTRYIAITISRHSKFLSSIYLHWNLHSLVIKNFYKLIAPLEIWNMPQLRHIEFIGGLYLPDPPSNNIDKQDDLILENLQKLLMIINFKCGKKVVKKIPNIKKLKVRYTKIEEGSSIYCLNNLGHLHQLESLSCDFWPESRPKRTDFLQNLTFPSSLKKLTLFFWYVDWEDMLEKISSLPLLEKLTLRGGDFKGRKWETVEGHFQSLKFLQIACHSLEYWTTESSHFPCLQHLVLEQLVDLKEIPSEIGEILTLQSIKLKSCSESAIISAKRILREQEELHGEVGLQVRVILSRWKKNEALESLASPNIQVRYE